MCVCTGDLSKMQYPQVFPSQAPVVLEWLCHSLQGRTQPPFIYIPAVCCSTQNVISVSQLCVSCHSSLSVLSFIFVCPVSVFMCLVSYLCVCCFSDAHFCRSVVIDRLKSPKIDCSSLHQHLGSIKIQFCWFRVPLFLRCCGQACYCFSINTKPQVSTKHRCVNKCIWTAGAPWFD